MKRRCLVALTVLAMAGLTPSIPRATAREDKVVGLAGLPGGGGYRLAYANGAVRSFGVARDHGSMGDVATSRPMVGIASTASGDGYWLVASDGGVFTFGDAGFLGSLGAVRLNSPVVGMAPTPSSRGYWLVAADGGVFAFGDARFFGSMGGAPLRRSIVGMSSRPGGDGYWLVAADGGVFAFGAAQFRGSMGGAALAAPVIGVLRSDSGDGYWMVGTDGGVFSFGDAPFHGSTSAAGRSMVIGMTERAARAPGYVIVTDTGEGIVRGPQGPDVTSTTGTSPTTTTTSPPPAGQGEAAIRDALVAWYNDERRARGMPSLMRDPELESKADEWVRDPRFRAEGHQSAEQWAANPYTQGFFAYGEGITTQAGSAAGTGGAHTSLFGSSSHRSLFFAATAHEGSVVIGVGVLCRDGELDVVLDVAQRRQSREGEPNQGNDLSFPSGPAEPQVHDDPAAAPRC